MRVPLEWLKEHVAVKVAPKALAERLTLGGLEVVGIHDSTDGPVFDIEITPNRADCLSILGVAREVAALTGQRLKLSSGAGGGSQGAREKRHPRPSPLAPRPRIHIEDRKGCARYVGRLIDGVRIGPSPDWMQRRLAACGVRPINNLVDITNYVLFEYGQPLHAFDFERLASGTILVRRAQPNERITTLDGVTRTLTTDMLVIADAKAPVAVAGVMGGAGSEVTPQTTRVLLESALFDPILVRRTARALGLASESSYRFERGVDPAGVEAASRRAAALIQELAGGAETYALDVGAKAPRRSAISLHTEHIQRLLGSSMSPTLMRTTLAKLSCRVASDSSGRTLRVEPPSFRRDLVHPVDLAEELARLSGYDRINARLPSRTMSAGTSEAGSRYARLQSLRCFCASLGLTEAITWSLVSPEELARCGESAQHGLRLSNPLSQDHAVLRPSLTVGLVQAVRRNLTQGAGGVRLFELGAVFRASEPSGKHTEQLHLGIALAGAWNRDWQGQIRADFFRLKGLVASLVERLCQAALHVETISLPWAEPGYGVELRIDGRPIGVAGQLARAIATAWDVEEPVWLAELSVEALLELRRASTTARAPSAFPPVKRDLSVVVDQAVAFERIARAVREVGGALAGRVELIDRYVGRQVPEGKHSLTFGIEYRDASRTLTAAEVDVLHQRISQVLASQFGAVLR
ncbi:MAG: phenylalanine--tRNA ligase subunit beta [Candidatus Omnitrophica bacterium CG11_big_fil_rev_8_21_14_0_20_63_9]|nr:MAG: phenylalanine--tRNA ligase subunit beta [Candidatus Omnitrophica bacterium CG11_big_fil_rev_8_21_14_0_20_63_9]